MKKNDVFTFTAPNGAEVQAVAIQKLHVLCDVYDGHLIVEYWLCYAQNRLFIWNERLDGDCCCAETLVDYAILPDYDALLEAYSRTQDTMRRAEEERKSLEEWEENLKTFEYEDDLTSK